MKLSHKQREILLWVITILYTCLILGVFVYWFMNDDMTEMQIFKEIYWWFLPSALVLLFLTKKNGYMKTKVTYFLLGLVMTLFLSATVAEELLTVKPAKPSHTVAYCGQETHEFTVKYAQRGYVVIATASQGYYNTYVVMGKFN